MQALTLILPFFCNRHMLAEHARIWADYPADVRKSLHVIVVDGGSPKGQRASAKGLQTEGLGSFRIYRVLKHVRWNWLASRNLGMAKALTSWRLLTDIDHVLPAETCDSLTTQRLDPDSVYRLARIDAFKPWPYTLAECPVREAKRFHPNTWLLTGKVYDKIGGYDERLAGCYGTDGEFKDRVHAHARAVVHLTDVMVRYPREIIPDASTTIYTRKNDPENDNELRERREKRDLIKNWKPLRGTFAWEQVC